MIDKKRMEIICSIFFDAGKYGNEERFKEIFNYYWGELSQSD